MMVVVVVAVIAVWSLTKQLKMTHSHKIVSDYY
jgi:hypothetical protein